MTILCLQFYKGFIKNADPYHNGSAFFFQAHLLEIVGFLQNHILDLHEPDL